MSKPFAALAPVMCVPNPVATFPFSCQFSLILAVELTEELRNLNARFAGM